MHISSLPGPFGIGVFGKEAKNFIDMLKSMNFHIWQVLPFHPVDFANSPYASESAFAGNYYFIDPRGLLDDGLIDENSVKNAVFDGSEYVAQYTFAEKSRLDLLKNAYASVPDEMIKKIDSFSAEHKWLDDYALFKSLRTKYNGLPWWKWDKKYAEYQSCIKYKNEFKDDIAFWKFVQYEFFKQWDDIKEYANKNSIKIIGDMPIYVALDSCDVWCNIENFKISKTDFTPTEVAGVPPDYFSQDGQLWGNPIYDWEHMEKDNYAWWSYRLSEELKLYDYVRIDHFRGLASYWSVPANSKTAKNGEWKKGPGEKLFNAVREKQKAPNIIAEDLGTFGEDVEKLLKSTGFPGIRVIQFGFDPSSDSTHLPHNYPSNSIACVGTHDNNTILGWLYSASEPERQFALDYCGFDSKNEDWGMGGYNAPACRKIIETVWRSSSKIAVIPIQDVCGFGCDTRMNKPGLSEDNWTFRISENSLNSIDKDYYKKINSIFKRS